MFDLVETEISSVPENDSNNEKQKKIITINRRVQVHFVFFGCALLITYYCVSRGDNVSRVAYLVPSIRVMYQPCVRNCCSELDVMKYDGKQL